MSKKLGHFLRKIFVTHKISGYYRLSYLMSRLTTLQMLHISLHVCTYVSIARPVNLSFEDVMELSKIVRSYRLKRIFVSKLLSIAKGGY